MKYNILMLNPISDMVNNYLEKETYKISDNVESPHGILVRSAKMHDCEINKELMCIARAGAGYNNIPYERCAKEGVVVFNTPGANANGVKELVICGMLLSARSIIDGINWVKTLDNQSAVAALVEKGKKNYAGNEIANKNLGIIGLGAIGALVANAAIGMSMKVSGYDPFMSVESALSITRAVSRETNEDVIYKNSDYISLHLPLLESTKHKINAETIKKLKPGVIILNFARGELVDNKAMIEALKSGIVSKYITDFPSKELIGVKGVIAIPHLGASTKESEMNCAIMAAKQIKDYIENGNIKNAVNMPECVLPRSGAYRLSIIHENIKNMVGQIMGILADEDHNITNMINKSYGQLAYMVIDLDDCPSDKCINTLGMITGLIKVRLL